MNGSFEEDQRNGTIENDVIIENDVDRVCLIFCSTFGIKLHTYLGL